MSRGRIGRVSTAVALRLRMREPVSSPRRQRRKRPGEARWPDIHAPVRLRARGARAPPVPLRPRHRGHAGAAPPLTGAGFGAAPAPRDADVLPALTALDARFAHLTHAASRLTVTIERYDDPTSAWAPVTTATVATAGTSSRAGARRCRRGPACAPPRLPARATAARAPSPSEATSRCTARSRRPGTALASGVAAPPAASRCAPHAARHRPPHPALRLHRRDHLRGGRDPRPRDRPWPVPRAARTTT